MKARFLFRPAILVVTTLGSITRGGEDSSTLIKPEAADLSNTAAGDGWLEWGPIGDLKGYVANRERITALSTGAGETIWVGSSRGRLFSGESDKCMLQAKLEDLQLTGIAVESPGTIWLSTNDGIRRLESVDDRWKLSVFRQYYEGRPSFVSGGYVPGEDAVRIWGHVDEIYVPPKNRTYAPLAVSREHGLFSWGGFNGVWHHFLPHYWGANSPWVDTRKLIRHRRPTCIVEDNEENLWVGTDGDGVLRFNAKARNYHQRDSEHNQKDGTELTKIKGPEHKIREIVTTPGRRVFAASWWSLYEMRGDRPQ